VGEKGQGLVLPARRRAEGPVSATRLRELLAAGYLRPRQAVWREGEPPGTGDRKLVLADEMGALVGCSLQGKHYRTKLQNLVTGVLHLRKSQKERTQGELP